MSRSAGTPAHPQQYVYKKVNGIDLRASVFGAPPPKDRARVRPTIVWLHGGALVLGTRHDLERTRSMQLDAYLDNGWVVVAIDYRLAPEDQLPAIWEDVSDAFAWVRGGGRQTIGSDPNLVAVVGPSCGGYLALLAGGKLATPPRAVVSFFGYGDIIGDWYARPTSYYLALPWVTDAAAWGAVGNQSVAELPLLHDRRDFYVYLRQRGLWPKVVGGDGPLEKFCPERLVTPSFPPTLLFHGESDTDVPLEQSLRMATALDVAGVPHRLRIVPGASHSFDRAGDAAARDAIAETVAFLTEVFRTGEERGTQPR